MKRRLPPASWIELAATAIYGRAGVDLDLLVDAEDAMIAWYMSGSDPRLLDLDSLDRTLAGWLGEQSATTRATYQLSLRRLARGLEVDAGRPVRALLELVAADPDALDERLGRLSDATGWRSGTIRNRLSALHQASRAMLRAGLVRRTVADERPANVDVRIENVPSEHVQALDAALAKSADPIDARTRAAVLLTWNLALRPEQLERMRFEELHLARACVVVDGELIYCGHHAAEAVGAWFDRRGHGPGPLFVSYDGRSRRLSTEQVGARSLQRSIAAAGAALGIPITLRALRNGALRELGSVDRRAAQRLSRNSSEDGVNRLLRTAHGGGNPDGRRTPSVR